MHYVSEVQKLMYGTKACRVKAAEVRMSSCYILFFEVVQVFFFIFLHKYESPNRNLDVMIMKAEFLQLIKSLSEKIEQ